MPTRPIKTSSKNVRRDSPDPIYRQIAGLLRDRIVSGQIKAGHVIPPESELMRSLEVSRVTVRQAVDLLVSEGLVVRKQGKGTFVSPPKIRENLHSLKGLAELMADFGNDQTMEVTSFSYVQADERLARPLGIPPGTEVLEIRRRHLLKGVPIAVAHIYLPREFGRRIQVEEVSSTPIYSLLKRKFRIDVNRATEVIRAAVCDRELSAMLDIPRGTPLLMVERTTYSTQEQPVEFIVFHHRWDTYEITVDLQRATGFENRQNAKALALVSAHLLESDPKP